VGLEVKYPVQKSSGYHEYGNRSAYLVGQVTFYLLIESI
jgi:hypothetical protein